MRPTENYGTELRPSVGVPVQNGSIVVADGEPYSIRGVTKTGMVRLDGREDMGKAEFSTELLQTNNIRIERDRPEIEEVSVAEYHTEIGAFKSKQPSKAAFVTIPVEADEYYLTVDGGSGFAIDGSSLVGLFNHTDPSGTGEQLVGEAIARGAQELMCFDTELTDLYRRWGFEETDRSEWNESLAPDNWDYDTFGRPDVVWMSL